MLLEQVQPDGNVYYYHADQLGSVRALTNQAGTVVNTYAYDAYGTTTASSETVANPLRYAGEYQDAETGLYYLRARYYDPATQQFLTRDPLVAATEQAYNYAAGSPLNATDPSGLMFATEGQGGGGWGLSPADMVGFGMFFSAGGGGGAGSGNGYLGRRSSWSPSAQEAEAADEGILNQAAGPCRSTEPEEPSLPPKTIAKESESTNPGSEGGSPVSAPGKITGYRKHGINQAISRDDHGVSTKAILDTVNNAIKTVVQANGNIRYIGRNAVVVLNPAGEVVTAWAKNSAGWRYP